MDTTPPTTRIVIANDHTLVREGTRGILQHADDLDVVGEAADGREAIDLVERERPDVAIVDIGMPGMNGIEVTREIKRRWPGVAVLVLTVHDEDAYVMAILEAGAAGYLLKDVPGDELIRAVRAVRDGESVLHPRVTDAVLRRVRTDDPHGHGSEPTGQLTSRELDVLRVASRGVSNKQIASELDLSPRTVQVHLGHVFRKLDVASRTEAVIEALRHGLVRLEDLP